MDMDQSAKKRLELVIDLSWNLIFEKIVNETLFINKESSLQLHLSKLIFDIGNTFCIYPTEFFDIEMETNYENKSIDIVCSLGDTKAALELKCFMKSSNRAKDLDCYDTLKDIERLQNYLGFDIKKFICLTDSKYYASTVQRGHAASVSIREGTKYYANTPVIPSWANKWKVNRDKPILFNADVEFNWHNRNQWFCLNMSV